MKLRRRERHISDAMNRMFLILSGVFIICCCKSWSAGLDDLQSEYLKRYQWTLNWYNVEGKPALKSEAEPEFDIRLNLHLFKIDPGREITVMIPPDEILRLTEPYDYLVFDDVAVDFSHGTGLWLRDKGQKQSDSNAVFYFPDSSAPVLARIKRPAAFKSPITLAVFVSRRIRLDDIAPYFSTVPLDAPETVLHIGDSESCSPFYRIEAREDYNVRIKGPLRLSVEARYRHPARDTNRFQNFQIFFKSRERLYRTLDCETRIDADDLVLMDDRPVVAGRLETMRFDIPEGVEITRIQSNVDLFIRFFALDSKSYLFSNWNSPPDQARMMEITSDYIAGSSIWSISDAKMMKILSGDELPASVLERFAMKILKDNERRGGAPAGVSLMASAARRRPEYPEIKYRMREMDGRHTFFRDLFPAHCRQAPAMMFNSFFARRLKAEPRSDLMRIAAEQHAADLVDNLPEAYFVRLPEFPENEKIVYDLPERFNSGSLRIVVDTSLPGSAFEICYDNGQAYEFYVEPESRVQTDWFIPSAPEMGAAVKRWRMTEDKIPCVFGTREFFDGDSSLIEAGVWEIPLPPGVQRVFVRSSKTSQPPAPFKIALQYKASTSFSLSETQFLNIRDMAGDQEAWFRTAAGFLAGKQQYPPNPGLNGMNGENDVRYVCYREMLNHLIPLRRFLRSRAESFTAFVPEFESSPDLPEKNSEVHYLIESACAFEADSQLICALEEWSEVIHATSGKQRVRALFERIRLLLILGEEYAAERQLKSIFVHSPEPEYRNRAHAELKQLYRDRNRPETAIALDAAMLLHHSDFTIIPSLVEELVDNGDDEQALMLSLIIPDNQLPEGHLLRVCLQMDWKILFHRIVDRLQDESEKHFLLGKAACDSGMIRRALDWFSQAGDGGKNYIDLIEEGLSIRNQLDAGSDDRTAGLRRWIKWRDKQPGPFVWRPISRRIDDHDGPVLLYGIARDLYSTAFKTRSQKPVRFKIIGPARLKIDMRPIHPPESDKPLEGWAVIRDKHRKCVYPIDRNTPVDGLINAMDGDMRIGRKETVELTVGSGIRELELFSDDFPMLVQVYQKHPESFVGVLPRMSFKTIAALFNDERRPLIDFIEAPKTRHKDDLLAILPRFSDSPVFADLNAVFQSPDTELHETVDRMVNNSFRPRNIEPSLKSDCAYCFDVGETVRTCHEAPAVQEKSVIAAMAGLAYELEKKPDEADRIIVEAHELFNANRSLRGLKSVFSRIDKVAEWKNTPLIQQSAGVKHVEIRGWNPESPSLRVVKAMTQPLSYEDHILFDERRMALYIENYEASTLTVSMNTMDAGFLPAGDMAVRCYLDDEPLHRIMLTSNHPESTFTLDVEPGEHVLHIEILEKIENQVLKINIRDPLSDQRIDSKRTVLENIYERTYHIATAEAPVVFEIEGPAVIRIDERRRGKQTIRYKTIGYGWEKVLLHPPPGEDRALFRVFRLMKSRPSEITRIRRTKKTPQPVPEPLIKSDMSVIPESFPIHDRYDLGGQEDGLFSLTGGFHRRAEEDLEGGSDYESREHDEFFEIEGAYRYYDEYSNRYSRLSVLSRRRSRGDPSYGIIGDLTLKKRGRPLSHRFLTHLYMQDVKTDKGEHAAWSAGLRTIHLKTDSLGLRTRHTPYISLFFRHSSLNKKTVESVETVDRDVFTLYKRDHKGGLRLGDTIVFRPWTDTEWFLRAVLSSNENYIPLYPDHVSLTYGWKQFIRDFQIDFQHKMTYYLEDNDRDGGYPENSVGVDLSWRRWRVETLCLEARAGLEWVSETGGFNGAAYLSVYYGNGRANRDFRPGEIDFPSLRKRRMYFDTYYSNEDETD